MSASAPVAYHFISGLPRSGSTLLAALLRQNPALHANIISPVGSLVGAVLRDMSQANETSLYIDDTQREAVLRGLFHNYYGSLAPGRTVLDTNRRWTARIDLLARLFPEAKMICCVRHVPWILDSIERLLRRNALQPSKIFAFDTDGTAYSRAEGLMGPGGLVGYALNALKQAIHGDQSGRLLLLLPYEGLASQPEEALKAVYAFLGLEPFRHDVSDIRFDATEFDARLGTPGLHRVGAKASYEERETILPPDLWARWEGASVWRDPAFAKRGAGLH